MKRIITFALSLSALLISVNAGAVKFTSLEVVDKDCLLIAFRDGKNGLNRTLISISATFG